GAVVLPGLDLDMPDDQWAIIGSEGPDGRIDASSRSHPQFGLSRLLLKLGIDRSEVGVLGEIAPELGDRAATLSQALAPAIATDLWSGWRASTDRNALARAFADVALIEAANEREEAAAIA